MEALPWTSEYDSLVENDVHVDSRAASASGHNVVTCKWIFKVKEEQKLLTARSARQATRRGMVARGFSQVEGVDYSETYAPVVKFTSVRVLCWLIVTAYRPATCIRWTW